MNEPLRLCIVLRAVRGAVDEVERYEIVIPLVKFAVVLFICKLRSLAEAEGRLWGAWIGLLSSERIRSDGL